MEQFAKTDSNGITRWYVRDTARGLWNERKRMLNRGYGYCPSVTSCGVRIYNWFPLADCIEVGSDVFGGESLPRYRWKYAPAWSLPNDGEPRSKPRQEIGF